MDNNSKVNNIVITKDFINTGEALISKEFLCSPLCILTIDKEETSVCITLTHLENIEWGERLFIGTFEECKGMLSILHTEIQSYKKYLRSKERLYG